MQLAGEKLITGEPFDHFHINLPSCLSTAYKCLSQAPKITMPPYTSGVLTTGPCKPVNFQYILPECRFSARKLWSLPPIKMVSRLITGEPSTAAPVFIFQFTMPLFTFRQYTY